MATDQKIKVLQFICPTGLFGAERWILALAKNFVNDPQVDCRLAISHESPSQNIAVFDKFTDLGLTAYKVPMRGRFDMGAVWRLAALMRRQNIDIIHTHGYKSDILGLLAAKVAGRKILATPHGFENVKDFKLQMFIKLGCHALRLCHAVAPLSDELRSDMLKLGIDLSKIHLITNGVDIDEVEKIKTLASSSATGVTGEKVIGYVGQLAFRKNIGAMINAFDLLFGERQDVRLQLIGDGPQRSELEQKARSLSCGSHIEFLGYRDDRLSFVKEFAIFSMTSSLEGIPRCMMEAMAMGIPAVAFAIPGVDKLIINDKTGLSVNFDDIEGLKDNWQKILSDQTLADQLGNAGRAHILANFSAQRMAKEYTGLYRKMLYG